MSNTVVDVPSAPPTNGTDPPHPPVTLIDPGDQGYHQFVIQQTANIPQLETTVREATRALEQIMGARLSWTGFLRQKYDLNEGDQIDADGAIVRAGPA